MLEFDGFVLKKIEKKHYPFILSWFKSNATVSGFINPYLALYDIERIQSIYDQESNQNLSFIIQTKEGIPLGNIAINIEWECRNGILDIMMASGSGNNYGIGLKVLNGVIVYCKEELNLRRIEMKVSSKNKIMMKLCRVFPKDEQFIIDIFEGKDDWDEKIKNHFSITQQEYEKNWEDYATKFIKYIIFNNPKSDLVLKNENYYKGEYVDFHVNSIVLPDHPNDLKNLLLMASGDFKKSDIYYKIPERFTDRNDQ
jgi:RimJ/RimL family protein N-acetyltransferase